MNDGRQDIKGSGLRPESVEEIDFPTVRRGYEPAAVKRRLRDAAEEIRRLTGQAAALSERVAAFEAMPVERLESTRVAEALGDEAAQLLQAARDASQQRVERAETESQEIVGKARTVAAAIVEEGRNEGRGIVVEAQRSRERMLADLARKHHAHRIEVEQLGTIRDRLLESLSRCSRALSEWIEELIDAGPQAVAAAERVGLRIAAGPEPTISQIEAEIEAARLSAADEDSDLPQAGGGSHAHDSASHDSAPRDSAPHDSAPHDSAGGASAAGPALEPDFADADSALDDAHGSREEPGDPSAPASEQDTHGASGAVSDQGAQATDTRAHPALSPTPADVSLHDDVRLYDMEAEADSVLGTGAPSQPGSRAGVEASHTDSAASSAAAEAIFARLRAVQTPDLAERQAQPRGPEAASDAAASSSVAASAVGGERADSGGDPEARTAERSESGDGDAAVGGSFAAASDEAASQPDSAEGAETPGADPLDGGGEHDELFESASSAAVGAIATELKRLVVDEQGELLDAIRGRGAAAVEAQAAASAQAYARSVRVPLEDFASDIGASVDDIDFAAAGAAVVSELVTPLRARLKGLLEETDDPAALSAAVRSLYREARTRAVGAAARRALSAGWS